MDGQAQVKIAPFGGKLKQVVMPAGGIGACPSPVFTGNSILAQAQRAYEAIHKGVLGGVPGKASVHHETIAPCKMSGPPAALTCAAPNSGAPKADGSYPAVTTCGFFLARPNGPCIRRCWKPFQGRSRRVNLPLRQSVCYGGCALPAAVRRIKY